MDVWEYFLQKQLEWAERGALPDRAPFEELVGSDGKRGRVHCNLELTEYAYLRVLEHVVVEGTGIHRELYAYSLIIDGAHAYGWAREPDHEPPVHEHEGAERRLIPAEPIALCDCIDKAWEMASEQAEALLRED